MGATDGWTLALLVATGGALGGVLRFWVAGRIDRRFSAHFPWGVLTVNVTGAAMVGLAAGLLLTPGGGAAPAADPPLWAFFVVGVLGSYTTVSAYSWQTLTLWRSGARLRAMLNLLVTPLLCLAAAAASWAATGALASGN